MQYVVVQGTTSDGERGLWVHIQSGARIYTRIFKLFSLSRSMLDVEVRCSKRSLERCAVRKERRILKLGSLCLIRFVQDTARGKRKSEISKNFSICFFQK